MARRMYGRIAGAVGSALAAVILVGEAMALGTGIKGTVRFAGGGPIPAGRVEVSLSGSDAAKRAGGGTSIDSTGKIDIATFALPVTGGGPVEVVVTVRGTDGQLIARGSETAVADKPLVVTLYPTMY